MFRVGVLSLSRFSSGELAEFAEEVERLGYDSLWLADERFYRDVYSSLTYCATRTTTLKLGVGVTDPYTRHPALTAMAIATLDEISAGRAILGMGAGVSGFEEMGLQRPKPARALGEAIELIRSLLRGETASTNGEVIRFQSGKLDFAAVRKNVPILVASNNRLGLQTAGAVADGAIMQGCVSERILEFFTGQVGTGAARVERPLDRVDLVPRLNVAIASDRKAARDAMRPGLVVSLIAQQPKFWTFEQAGLAVPDEIRARVAGLKYTHDPSVIAPIAPLIPDEWVDALTLAGEPDYVANELLRISRRGIRHVLIYPVPVRGGPVDIMRAFARDVLPALSAAQ